MCRLVAYLGCEVLLDAVLLNPVNSLLQQSLRARESEYPTNGDGFGLGWYSHEISSKPALFKSISPAWNDQNLLHLASKIKSTCFFGHVRAASAGGVTHYNCHPFSQHDWMFMHNGSINEFIKVKRHIRHLLEDDIYNWIKGETDSEHLFGLFLQIAKGRDLTKLDSVVKTFNETLQKLDGVMKEFGNNNPSYLNICITDGKRILASRYCTDKKTKPESMHYAIGSRFELINNRYHMVRNGGAPKCVLIASEMLTDFSGEWYEVPEHHLLLVDSNFKISLLPIS